MEIMEPIKYKEGFKYQLVEDFAIRTGITKTTRVQTDFITMAPHGHMTIKAGYAWDGPSGPTFDTPNFLRGSLVHDALYQMMRQELLDIRWRPHADKLLYELCRADGMGWFRAQYVKLAVRWFASGAADPAHKKKVLQAP